MLESKRSGMNLSDCGKISSIRPRTSGDMPMLVPAGIRLPSGEELAGDKDFYVKGGSFSRERYSLIVHSFVTFRPSSGTEGNNLNVSFATSSM